MCTLDPLTPQDFRTLTAVADATGGCKIHKSIAGTWYFASVPVHCKHCNLDIMTMCNILITA
jgi:hypothetical protein